ncbi:MAG: HAMP domain-containing histidine kinase [Clostridiales bacterium]|nr:HAMP domain-containing histidine kinase [Clostridiales bacterium]
MVFYIIVNATLSRQTRDRVTRVGTEVVALLERRPDDKVLKQLFLRYQDEGIVVYILSEDGAVVLPEISISESRAEEAVEQAATLSVGDDVAYRSEGFVNFCSKVTYNESVNIILVSCPLVVVREIVTDLQVYLILVSIIALLLAFLISYTISQRLTRGLKNLSSTAVRFAHGDYSVEFANADYREVAQLSDTLNFVRDEVKKSRDFQREILANVTHDLKTPLTMIKAYASMVQEISGDNPEKRNQHLQVIIDEADRLTGLVDDVLSVSKVNSNLGEIHFKVFNLTEFLYGIINKFGYLQESGYNLMVDIDPDLYTRADEEKIEQVIYNLLGNAVSYTGEDKTVFISLKTSMDGKRIKLSIRDTGKGIPKEELPNIWDRYYRSEESHTRPVKGTGLGLNIVKVILENHSFDYGVESEKGKGSTFWVDFPSVPAE